MPFSLSLTDRTHQRKQLLMTELAASTAQCQRLTLKGRKESRTKLWSPSTRLTRVYQRLPAHLKSCNMGKPVFMCKAISDLVYKRRQHELPSLPSLKKKCRNLTRLIAMLAIIMARTETFTNYWYMRTIGSALLLLELQRAWVAYLRKDRTFIRKWYDLRSS